MYPSLPLLFLCFLLQHPTSPSYNIQTSKFYAALSGITHCHASNIKAWDCKLCKLYPNFTDTIYIENNVIDIVGFAGYDRSSDNIVLAWRGTVDHINWIEDFSFDLIAYTCPQCKVHLGFYSAYRSVALATENAVSSLLDKHPSATIVVTGHSLGAAISGISAIQLSKTHPSSSPTTIHNFGCPRIGNHQLSNFITTHYEHYRVIHSHDLVPHLPPMQLNYHHYPYQVLFDQDMEQYQVCDGTGEDEKCSNGYFPDFNTKDHDSYFNRMDGSVC